MRAPPCGWGTLFSSTAPSTTRRNERHAQQAGATAFRSIFPMEQCLSVASKRGSDGRFFPGKQGVSLTSMHAGEGCAVGVGEARLGAMGCRRRGERVLARPAVSPPPIMDLIPSDSRTSSYIVYDRVRQSVDLGGALGGISVLIASEPSRTPRQYRARCAHYRTAPPVETGVSVVHFSFCAQARVRTACISKAINLGTHHLGIYRSSVRSNSFSAHARA